MLIAMTGATGFLGRHLVRRLVQAGHRLRCWYRETSERGGFSSGENARIEWIPGELGDELATRVLVEGADGLVHAAIDWPRCGEAEQVEYVTANIQGALQLLNGAREAGLGRFLFLSSTAACACAPRVERLGEHHPCKPASLYGGHKAAIEKLIEAMGTAHDWQACVLRASGLYGIHHEVEKSRWYPVISDVVHHRPVQAPHAGRVVHVEDVARAAELLLAGDPRPGQIYHCGDLHISDPKVAAIAKRLTGSRSEIEHYRHPVPPPLDTRRIEKLGMEFGGKPKLVETIKQLVKIVRQQKRNHASGRHAVEPAAA